MMKFISARIFSLFFIPAMALLLYSCEKDANVKLPDIKSQLVVTSFISPSDTLITVNVSETRPLYTPSNNSNNGTVDNAIVYLSDGINSVVVPYNNFRYSINSSLLPIFAGHTYFLSVATPDGRLVNAETTVPSGPVPVIATSYHEAINNGSENGAFPGEIYTVLQLNLNDPSGIKNYYRTDIRGFEVNPDTVPVGNMYGILKEHLETDEGQDGKTIAIEKGIYNAFSIDSELKFFEVTLLNCNYPYYAYHKSLMSAVNSGGVDLFSEPSIMYSNINGGLGVFGAYISSKTRLYR
ncbi:MAG: DUF4249 domain-containing protein [Bacteroidota bacterium]